jgi:predicted DNA-binding transcriptional regulator AlpA
MTDTYLSDTDLSKRYKIARPSVWRWHREQPDFPRAIRFTAGCTRWKLSEVIAWEALKAEAAA